jgi:endoglucanase
LELCEDGGLTKRVLLALVIIPFLKGASPQIKVDQVGYAPRAPKYAFLALTGGTTGQTFTVRRDGDNRIVLTGSWTAPVSDPDSGDQVQTADFTAVDTVGSYYLEVPGVGRSWPFRIAPDVYQRPYYLAARGFYGQRCGTAVDLGAEFPGYQHGICHVTGAYDPSSGKIGYHGSTKGWHDAGDYGRYMVNAGIATATLLWASELWGGGAPAKIALAIPESGNGTPDLLNEARWNIDWMLSMQDADGGVWHKQTSAHFCGFIMPEKDTQPSLVIGAGKPPFKTSCATADFAGVTAIAARVFATYDKPYADLCLNASRRAWKWVEAHPDVTFRNPTGITTGEYADEHCTDEVLWAAAELARTTREAAFETYFQRHYRDSLDQIAADNPPDWSNMAPFALWTYALGKGSDKAAVDTIRARSMEAADAMLQRAAGAPYQTTMVRKNYIWGSNGVAANYALQLLIANRLHPNQRYVETAMENLHYLFGRNSLSLCFVTQLGSNTVEHIHHRPSVAGGLPRPWPGLLSGGPNAGRQDPEMQKSVPANTPPARAFLDVSGSYASNEIAINWNAPLVFALAGVLE